MTDLCFGTASDALVELWMFNMEIDVSPIVMFGVGIDNDVGIVAVTVAAIDLEFSFKVSAAVEVLAVV